MISWRIDGHISHSLLLDPCGNSVDQLLFLANYSGPSVFCPKSGPKWWKSCLNCCRGNQVKWYENKDWLEHSKCQKQVQCIKGLQIVIGRYELKHLDWISLFGFGWKGPWTTNITCLQRCKSFSYWSLLPWTVIYYQ